MLVDPVRRWKVISAVLAVVAVYALRHEDAPTHAATKPSRAARIDAGRSSAPATSLSAGDIARRMLSARSVMEVRKLAVTLGAVGDDAAIDRVRPLLEDPREGVAEAVLHAIAAIGTDHAVELLLQRAEIRDTPARDATIVALGETRDQRAEDVLVRLATQRNDDSMSAAIDALGTLATERAIVTLERLATSNVDSVQSHAMDALGAIDTPGSRTALVRLLDTPSIPVAVAAINRLAVIDETLRAKLQSLVHASDRRIVAAAIEALAKAGEVAVPALVDAAFQGPRETRVTAVHALASTRSDDALAPLTTLLSDPDGEVATAAAYALANLATEGAREALISQALSGNDEHGFAADHLLSMSGPDVEAALFELAKSDEERAHRAMRRLIELGNREAFDRAIEQLYGGTDDERGEALEWISAATSAEANDALLSVVRDPSSPHRARALDLLTDARIGDPDVEAEMRAAVTSSDDALARVAIKNLGRVGTDEARDALLAAVRNPERAYVALEALDDYRLSEAAGNELIAVAEANPAFKHKVTSQLLTAGHPGGLRLAESLIANAANDLTDAGVAIDLLAASRSPEAMALLDKTARAPGHPARATALRSLGELHDDRTFEVTRDALRDSDADVRNAAAQAMAATHTSDARDALLDLSRASDPGARLAAVEHLRDFSDAHTVSRYRDLMRDPDPTVAMAAMEGMRVAPTEDIGPALESILRDTSRPANVRVYAGQVLRRYAIVEGETAELIDSLETVRE